MKGSSGVDRLPSWLSVFIFAIPLIPSPALVPVFQFVLGGLGAVFLSKALTYYGNSSPEYKAQNRELIRLLALIGLLTFISNVGNDPSVSGGLKTAMIRGAFFTFVLIFAIYLGSLTDEGLRRVFRVYIIGVAILCVIAIYISLTGHNFTGERLRPTRGIGLLPSGFKTAGFQRSYGEYALIVTGGLGALLWMWRDYPRVVRWGLLTLLIFGVSVSHSRNAYMSAGFLGVVFLASKFSSPLSEPVRALIFRILGYCAIFSPVMLAAFLGSSIRTSSIGAYFVGEGVFEANVEARSNHVRYGLDILLSEPDAILGGTTVEAWQKLIQDDAIPHNHFISLIVFGMPVLGLVIIYLLFFRTIRLVATANVSERLFAMAWLVSSLFALSNYQGLFAPSAALMLGLAFSIPLRQLNREVAEDELGQSRIATRTQ